MLSSPFWNSPCPIAFLCVIVECLAELATVATWCFTIDAHIEKLAIIWISVTRMSGAYVFAHFGACKFEYFYNDAGIIIDYYR